LYRWKWRTIAKQATSVFWTIKNLFLSLGKLFDAIMVPMNVGRHPVVLLAPAAYRSVGTHVT
jgi:hypothetical protein